jgi:carboxypeptidase Q
VRKWVLSATLILACGFLGAAQSGKKPPKEAPPASAPTETAKKDAVDLDVLYKLKQEALQKSQVMKTLSILTDAYGGRLTGSPNTKLAADWSMKQMQSWGLANVHLEPWEFGRGWVNERFSANVVAPVTYPLIGYALAWTPGTNGAITSEAIYAPMEKEADFEKYRGKLKGKFALAAPMRDIELSKDPLSRRYTDAELAEIAQQPIQGEGLTPEQRAQIERFRGQREFNAKRNKFLLEEGVAAVFTVGRGDGGTVFVQSGGSRDPKDPPVPTQVILAGEHYNRIARTLEDGVPVSIELSVQNRFLEGDGKSFDVIGEIPGTDLADQVVMIGAHFDSWHAGTGATDNGVGSAVMLEVMRVLKSTGVKLRRTVRIGLWTGEEQGLLGSRAYVKEHFADRETMQLKQEHAKLDVYFNIDNGSGKLRGVYLQGNEAAGPIFRQWMEPFANTGMTTLSIRNTGGTDHLAFDAVGLPGFQFIQDPLEYDTRTHHSNMDVYDRVQAGDLKQMAAVVATFVYQAANREGMFPRKPLPPPQPALPPGGPPRM